MNKIRNIIYLLLAMCFFWVFSCKEEPGEDNEYLKNEMTRDLTANAWMVNKITHETDGDVTSQYADMVVTFSENAEDDQWDGAYTSDNGGVLFPASNGKWRYVDDSDFKTLEREDGVIMQITEITDNTLTLEVEMPSSGEQARMEEEQPYDQESENMRESSEDTAGMDSAARQRQEAEHAEQLVEEAQQGYYEPEKARMERQSSTMSASGTFVIEFDAKK